MPEDSNAKKEEKSQSSKNIEIPPIPKQTVGAVAGAAAGSIAGPIGAVVGGVVGAVGSGVGRLLNNGAAIANQCKHGSSGNGSAKTAGISKSNVVLFDEDDENEEEEQKRDVVVFDDD